MHAKQHISNSNEVQHETCNVFSKVLETRLNLQCILRVYTTKIVNYVQKCSGTNWNLGSMWTIFIFLRETNQVWRI